MNPEEKEFYFSIEKRATAEFKDRGSRFIAYAYPLEDLLEFKQYLKDLKKTHPKAAHHCFAYRMGLEGQHFRTSDDGEPSGTAGRPILGQIDSRELTNTLIAVVRYFGGTLLGVSGLINAYRSAASLVLQTVPVIRKPVESIFVLEFEYNRLNEIMNLVRAYGVRFIEKEVQLFCRMVIAIPKNMEKSFRTGIEEANYSQSGIGITRGSLIK